MNFLVMSRSHPPIFFLIFLFLLTGSFCCKADEPADSLIPLNSGRDKNISTGRPKLRDISEGKWEVPRWSLKTNVIPWLAMIPNITGEVRLNTHIAVDLGLWWCPWKISDKYSLKIFAILPEGRWWINDEATGHFFDVHLTCAWFNLRFNNDRYQDTDRPLLGAGIGYGYLFRLNENWGIELSIGAGYFNMKYNTYYNIPNGAYNDTRRTSYWGIDRAGVSVVYRFTS